MAEGDYRIQLELPFNEIDIRARPCIILPIEISETSLRLLKNLDTQGYIVVGSPKDGSIHQLKIPTLTPQEVKQLLTINVSPEFDIYKLRLSIKPNPTNDALISYYGDDYGYGKYSANFDKEALNRKDIPHELLSLLNSGIYSNIVNEDRTKRVSVDFSLSSVEHIIAILQLSRYLTGHNTETVQLYPKY